MDDAAPECLFNRRIELFKRHRSGDVAPPSRAGRHEEQRQHRRDKQEHNTVHSEVRSRRMALEAIRRGCSGAVGRDSCTRSRLGGAFKGFRAQVETVDDRVQQRELQMHLTTSSSVPAKEAAGTV